MKVLGVSGSPRAGRTTDRLVQAVLQGAECETEFIALAGREIRPCSGCLGCLETNVCVIDDDMRGLRKKIVEADAYVVGGATYFNTLNGLAHCFLERWYQFRHREGAGVIRKPGVAVGVGGHPEHAARAIQEYFRCNLIRCVAVVKGLGVSGCFICGYGKTCEAGALRIHGQPDATPPPDLSRQPKTLASAWMAGRLLSDRLKARVSAD